MFKRLIFVPLLVSIFFSCTAIKKSTSTSGGSISRIGLLNTYIIPYNLHFRETTVGGLSGIDYDAEKKLYYMICDDRSQINPARFYTASILLNNQKIDTVFFTAVAFLKDENNRLYPGSKADPKRTPDPEALRYNPHGNNMIWSSEGERIVRGKDTVLNNPSISITDASGKWIDSFYLPANLYMHAAEKGPRQNGVLEGMSFADNFKILYVNVEEPLYEDGPKAETVANKAFIRLFKFDVASKKNTAQFAYELDPVAFEPTPATAFKVNGVPDLLDLGNNRLLVIERSFSTGRIPCTIKLFIADLNTGTDISANPSLNRNTAYTPVKKTLLLNMDELGIFTDNIEGVSFGPTLANGHRTLIFIADNNFAAFQQQQVLLFEIFP
jgi:hypothetical protein